MARNEASGRLQDKVVVVTGASRGVGRATVHALLAEGAKVVGVARSSEGLAALAAELADDVRASFLPAAGDVADADAVEKTLTETLQRFGRVDVLVNNAGVGHYAPATQLSEAEWDEMMAVNLKGPHLWTQAVLPQMIERRDGHIIMIASIAGVDPFPNGSGYCASKAGLIAYADVLRQELKPHELRVTTICPGSIQTDFAGTPPKDYALLPEDVAKTIVETAASPKRVIYGTILMRPLVPSGR